MYLIEKTMTSLEMAELSGKRHDNVKTDIETILRNVEIDFLKFQDVSKNHRNQSVTIYRLPKPETLLVTSKWSDDQRWKIIQKLETESSLTPAEQLLRQAQALVNHEREIADLKYQQMETQAQVAALVNGEDYFTITGYGNVVNIKVDSTSASKLGKTASNICRRNNWKIGSTTHPLWGEVNTYPRQALDETFSVVMRSRHE